MDNKYIKDLCWIPIFTDFIISVGKNLHVWKYTDEPQFYLTNKSKENKWVCIWNKVNPGFLINKINIINFQLLRKH